MTVEQGRGVDMFVDLRVGNFQGFKGEHEAHLAPLTLVFGANSSGKSALIRALTLLTQSVPTSPLPEGQAAGDEAPRFNGSLVDLGDFRSVAHAHDLRVPIRIGATYEDLRRDVKSRRPAEPESVDLEFRWDSSRQVSRVSSVVYRLKDQPHRDVRFKLARGAAVGETSDGFRVHGGSSFRNITNDIAEHLHERFPSRVASRRGGLRQPLVETLPELRRLAQCTLLGAELRRWGFLPYLDPPNSAELGRSEYELLRDWGHMLFMRARTVYDLLSSIRYVGPLRTSPRRIESGNLTPYGYVGPSGQGTAQLLLEDPGLLLRVNAWLDQLEIPYQVAVQKVSGRSYPTIGTVLSVGLTDKRTGVVASPADVGFGISQVLPVVTQSLLSTGQTIVIEQPEVHLHPRLQARLGSLFADVINSGPNTQIIAETHSEMLVLRVQRLVVEGILSARDVQILFVGSGPEGSWIQEIPLSETGELLEEWPGGFFEERYEEWGI